MYLHLVQMCGKQYNCRLWYQTCITLTLRQAEIAEDVQQRLQDAAPSHNMPTHS